MSLIQTVKSLKNKNRFLRKEEILPLNFSINSLLHCQPDANRGLNRAPINSTTLGALMDTLPKSNAFVCTLCWGLLNNVYWSLNVVGLLQNLTLWPSCHSVMYPSTQLHQIQSHRLRKHQHTFHTYSTYFTVLSFHFLINK